MIKSSISEVVQFNVSHNFLKCIIYAYFGFMLSNLLHAKLCLLYLMSPFAVSKWQFISLCSLVISG